MKARCDNPQDDPEERYYFQGIIYYDAWEHFEPFMEWASSHGYDDNLSLDRINPYGNYEPSNCRWIPLELQARNTTVQYRRHFQDAFAAALSYVDSSILPEQVLHFVQEQYNESYLAQQLKTMSFDLLDLQSTEALDYFLTENYKALLRIYAVAFVDNLVSLGHCVDEQLSVFQAHCLRELELQQQVFDQQSWPLPVVYHDVFQEASMKRE